MACCSSQVIVWGLLVGKGASDQEGRLRLSEMLTVHLLPCLSSLSSFAHLRCLHAAHCAFYKALATLHIAASMQPHLSYRPTLSSPPLCLSRLL